MVQLNVLKIDFDETLEDVRINEILKNFENFLELKLQIKRLFLEVSRLNQAILILKHINPKFLKKLEIKIRNLNREVSIENLNFLVDWNEGKPLKLVLKMDKIFEENLESVNKLFSNWTSFTEIDLIYESFDSDPSTFFDVPFKFEKIEDSKSLLNFRLNSKFKLAPSAVVNFDKLDFENLEFFSSEKSAKVFENPLILERILSNLGLFNIQRLRKTSSGIRACVDHLNPETNVNTYFLLLKTPKSAYTCYDLLPSDYKIIEYSNPKNLGNSQIFPKILTDFEVNLRSQRACMKSLELNFSYSDETRKWEKSPESEIVNTSKILNQMTSEFLPKLQKILEKRSECLKVRRLTLASVRPEDVLQILPYLDSESLNFLKILDPCSEYCRLFSTTVYPESLKTPYDLEEISKTEQWDRARELSISCASIPTSIQKLNLTNFSIIHELNIQTLTAEDIVYLKENLLKSSTLKCSASPFKNLFALKPFMVSLVFLTEFNTRSSEYGTLRFRIRRNF